MVTKTLQQEYFETYDADGEYFAFASYENAFAFAAEREKSYIRTGEWKSEIWDTGIAMDSKDSVNAVNGIYFIYKKSGDPNEEVAYFTQERLNEVIAEYAKQGIENYYYWEKEPTTIAKGENLFSYSDGRAVLADAVVLGENIACLLNGEPFIDAVVEREGVNVLTVSDDWGNSCEYTLIIVRRAPDILYSVDGGEANIVTFDRTYYFKDTISVSISDAYDTMAMFNVYGKDGTLLGSYKINETHIISESGEYTVEAINHFGKSKKFSLIISRNAPKILIEQNTKEKTLDVMIIESTDRESHLQTLEIYKSIDGGETWVLLQTDDYGKKIALETLSYSFRTSGLYKVVITDEFRTGIDAIIDEITYEQPIPEGVLEGVENGGYTNGKVTFSWTDEAKVTLIKDGKEIPYTSEKKLYEDGFYVLTFENFDGYKVIYEFVIDTIAPEVTLEGAENGDEVSGDIRVIFTEEGVSAEIFKDGILVGEYISGSIISESGAYRVVVSDLAGNQTEVTFAIDKFVDFDININDKGLSNSVVISPNEVVTIILKKDGKEVEYTADEAITVPGEYFLTLVDELGNRAEMSFTIVKPLIKEFVYNFKDMPGFEKMFVNGEEKSLNEGKLALTADGKYKIEVTVNGNMYGFTITIDGTAPTLTLNGVENGGTTKENVSLSELSEQAEVKVYLNGEEIEYKLGEKLKQEGSYKVTVTDICGNSTVYEFHIESGINGAMIGLIVGGICLLIGLVVILILVKKSKGE